MDPRLEKALDFANYRATIANQRENLKKRIAVLKICHHEGAQFTASKTNIAFVKAMIDSGYDSGIIEDDKQNPIEIKDLEVLLQELSSAYHSAMNEFLVASIWSESFKNVLMIVAMMPSLPAPKTTLFISRENFSESFFLK